MDVCYNKTGDNMKKIELHVHLDGSLNIEKVNEIVGYDAKDQLMAKDVSSLHDYLKRFDLPISLLQDTDSIKMFSTLLMNDLEKDDVIYAEVRFCPLLHTKYLTSEQVIDAVLEGLKQNSSVKANLILCMMRHFSFEDNMHIIDLASKYLGKGVVAIDLAGDEAKYPTIIFSDLFEEVKRRKIPFTVHAGEAASFQSVDAALSFGATRIGHGVRSIESDATVEYLKDHQIYLEICPTSNIDTKVYSNIEFHPIKKLLEAGILVTINTDNRTVSNTSLEQEYILLKEAFGFSIEDFKRCNLNALEASFLSDSEKEIFRNILTQDQ